MVYKNPYLVLNLPLNSSLEEVKKAYKAIALKSHPDKLNRIIDINEKNNKIKEFMEATNAYNSIIKGGNLSNEEFNFEGEEYNFDDWMETFNSIKESSLFKEVINSFMKFRNRIKKHSITVEIKYSDYYSKNKKKLRIFLKNIQDPVYINLDCSKFPVHIINYYDDSENEHEITINMILINEPTVNMGFYHIEEDDYENNEETSRGKINIYYDMTIEMIDYIRGTRKELLFVNKETLEIEIKPFNDCFVIEGFGINKGDLVIVFIINPIKKEQWNKITEKDKTEIIRIFEGL